MKNYINFRNVLSITGKELRSYFSSPAAYITIILFLIITGWFYTNTLFIDGGTADLRSNFNIIPFLLLFFVPALTMKMIAEEKRSGTIELLTTLPVSHTDIILGKFLATFAVLTAAVLLTVPNVITVGILGNPDWGVLFGGYAGLIFLGAGFTAIGIYTSSVTDNQIVAFIVSFFILFALISVSNFLIFLPFQDVFSYLGSISHYSNMTKGMIDSRDIVYFLSMIILFLTGAAKRLQGSKS